MRIHNTKWNLIYSKTDANDAWTTFNTIITEIMDEVAPMKEIRIKNRTDPWINSELLHHIEHRDNLLRQLTRHKDNVELRQEYNRARNKLARDIKTAKADYFYRMVEEYKHEHRKPWKQLKKTGHREKPKETPAMVLDIDADPSHDKIRIANYFNTFFTTVSETLARNLPVPPNKFTKDTPTFQNYYTNKGILPNRFTLATVSTDFTLRELIKLKTNKSTEPDKLPARFLNNGAKIIAEPLTHIMNTPAMTDTVPKELKEALVIPIYKK